jgi:4-amino-4-deoxy-L-arabinose transferase-like glycosyltransferase
MVQHDSSALPAPKLLSHLPAAIGSHPRLVLTIVVALLGLAGLSTIPPIDRDEPDFAQPARQMLESGNFIDIQFQNAPLQEKPIFTYWLQAASAALFGGPEHNRIAAYRLPSVLAVWLAALLTYELALTLFGRRAAFSAAVLFASLPLVQVQAHQARADALLLAAMLGTVVPLARAYVSHEGPGASRSTPANVLFWVSLATSILIKGPVVPVLIAVAALTLSVLERDWRWLHRLQPWWGVPLFLLVLLPWPVVMLRSNRASFFVHAWQADIFPKLISAQESHGAPPLTYALLAPLVLWPAALLLPSAVEFAWRKRRDLRIRFCLASVLPGWLLFELAPTKLPHYVLPFVPMLSVLMAVCVDKDADRPPSHVSSRVGAVLFVVAGLLIVGAIIAAVMRLGTGFDVITATGTVVLIASMIAVAVKTWSGRLERRAVAAAVCGILASLLIFGSAMPRLQRLWVADRAARMAASIADPALPVLVVGYHEPSLVFLLGTRTRFVDAKDAVDALEAHQSSTAIAASTSASELVRLAHASAVDLQEIAKIEGIDPVHGRPIELGIWTNFQTNRGRLTHCDVACLATHTCQPGNHQCGRHSNTGERDAIVLCVPCSDRSLQYCIR